MRRLVCILLLALAVTTPCAHAEDEKPTTLVMPTRLLASVRQYLATRPYDEVAGYIAALESCARVQTPDHGVIRSTGDCPEATAALQEQATKLAAEKKRADDAEALVKAAENTAAHDARRKPNNASPEPSAEPVR